jgi:LysM repeat protein
MINRKNTILLAVLINAGLLLVLFVTALTSKDEIAPVTPVNMAESVAPLPLFGEEIAAAEPVATPEALGEPVAIAPSPLVHALPPLVQPVAPAIAIEASPQIPVAAAPAPKTPSMREVVVKKGESLERIAKTHRTTVDEIIKLNHLSSSFLRVGQIIKVPAEKSASIATAIVSTASADKGADYYVVKVGDNPWTIAMKHHLKVEELLKLNGLNEQKARKLKPGDRLRVKKES